MFPSRRTVSPGRSATRPVRRRTSRRWRGTFEGLEARLLLDAAPMSAQTDTVQGTATFTNSSGTSIPPVHGVRASFWPYPALRAVFTSGGGSLSLTGTAPLNAKFPDQLSAPGTASITLSDEPQLFESLSFRDIGGAEVDATIDPFNTQTDPTKAGPFGPKAGVAFDTSLKGVSAPLGKTLTAHSIATINNPFTTIGIPYVPGLADVGLDPSFSRTETITLNGILFDLTAVNEQTGTIVSKDGLGFNSSSPSANVGLNLPEPGKWDFSLSHLRLTGTLTTQDTFGVDFHIDFLFQTPVDKFLQLSGSGERSTSSFAANATNESAGQFHDWFSIDVLPPTYILGAGVAHVTADIGVLGGSGSGVTVTTTTATGAAGGTFAFQPGGSFTYTPSQNFPGLDSVQYAFADSQGHKGGATVTVLSQPGGVVWKFYESVLDRAPDPGGLQYWTYDFTHGGKTGDIAVGFFESNELLGKVIGNYYQQYLGRTLDAGGLQYWQGQWHATGGPELIKAGFAASPEFNKNAGNTVDGWLTALYQRILDRTPDPQGFQYWRRQLAGGISESNVALGFFDSLEAYKNDVTGWFDQYLGRAPSNAELTQYSLEMAAGLSDRAIEQQITNLPEYGSNPPAPPAGAGARLPDYHLTSASPSAQTQAVAAKDALFSQLGS